MNRINAALQSTCDGPVGTIWGPRSIMNGDAVSLSYTYFRWTEAQAIAMLDAAGIQYLRVSVDQDCRNVTRCQVIVPISEWN